MSDGLHATIVAGRPDGFTLDLLIAVEPGETVAVLGPNGAGKSTLVDVIAGTVPLTAGELRLAGRVIDGPTAGIFVPPQERQVGIVFQDHLLFDHLTVVDNVAFGLTATGVRRRVARAAATELLELVGLGGYGRAKPTELSGGQARRVAVARALALDPAMLVFDEPLAALDVATATELRRLLVSRLAGFAGPRLLITHDPGDAFVLADRLCIIEDGGLVQSGTPDEVRRHPASPYVAALAGVNLLAGHNRAGAIALDGSTFVLRTSDTTSGPVRAVVHPRAVSLHPDRPGGSPRNAWATTVRWVEPLGETVRVMLDAPLPLMVDITPSAATALAIGPGAPIWAAVKATEVAVQPA